MKKYVINKVNHCDLADCRVLQLRTQKCSEELEMKKSCETAALPHFFAAKVSSCKMENRESCTQQTGSTTHLLGCLSIHLKKGLWRVRGALNLAFVNRETILLSASFCLQQEDNGMKIKTIPHRFSCCMLEPPITLQHTPTSPNLTPPPVICALQLRGQTIVDKN